MSWFDDQLTALAQSPAAAGVAGTLLSLRWAPGNSWASRAWSVAGGLALVIWGAPYAVEALGITAKAGPPAIGFLAGFLGLNLLSKLWDWVAATSFGELLSSFWRKPS